MTKSVTLLFPGQGSQYVGMGKNLEGHPSFDLFSKANEVLGYNLSSIMFEGPEEELTSTQNTQPAILNHSIALFQKLKEVLDEKGVKVDRVLGHSVGEYAALVAAGVLSIEDATKAVHLRGKFMQEAVPAGKGKMVAVLKVPEDKVLEACKASSNEAEIVMPANFNEPNQIVISGDASACDRAVAWLNENMDTPFRSVELKVSAPFHSTLMEPAAEKLMEELKKLNFNSPQTPYIANIDAKEYGHDVSADSIRDNLYKQVAGSVLWTQSIQSLPEDTLCIEVGPGRVLMGLVRKINRNIKVLPLDKDGAFDELKELLG